MLLRVVIVCLILFCLLCLSCLQLANKVDFPRRPNWEGYHNFVPVGYDYQRFRFIGAVHFWELKPDQTSQNNDC